MRAHEIILENNNSGLFIGIRLSAESISNLTKWQAKNNIPNPFKATELHVTLLSSKNQPFPWKPKKHNLKLDPKTYKLKKFGENEDLLVLCFDSNVLQYRHHYAMQKFNLQWDFDSYKPHITLAKDLPSDFDISKISVPNFVIVLTDEYVEKFHSDLKEFTMNDIVRVDSANSGAYISPKGEIFELDKHFAHMDTLRDSPYGKELENKIINKFGKKSAFDPYNESGWHSVAQDDGWIKVTWTVYRGREKVVLFVEFRKPTLKAVQELIKWISKYKDEFDLFRVNTEASPNFNGFVRLLKQYPTITETAGVGTIQNHNTTIDVKPGEIQRQAKKWGWNIDKDGNPPNISTIHKQKKKKKK